MYQLSGVSRLFRQGPKTIRAVDRIDLDIEQGEMLVIAGRSGSGKTTLLQLLGGLDRPTLGALLFEGRDLAGLSNRELTRLRLRTFGFVFQQFNLIPTLTAAENVEVPMAAAGMGRATRRRAAELLAEVGLAERASHLPSQLSGGEQQRVAIARALANDPRVLLADEPTGNLDSRTGEEVVRLLMAVGRERGATVLVVTHDRDLAGSASRLAYMGDGRLLTEPGRRVAS